MSKAVLRRRSDDLPRLQYCHPCNSAYQYAFIDNRSTVQEQPGLVVTLKQFGGSFYYCEPYHSHRRRMERALLHVFSCVFIITVLVFVHNVARVVQIIDLCQIACRGFGTAPTQASQPQVRDCNPTSLFPRHRQSRLCMSVQGMIRPSKKPTVQPPK